MSSKVVLKKRRLGASLRGSRQDIATPSVTLADCLGAEFSAKVVIEEAM